METIGLIIIIIWGLSKLSSGTNNKGRLNNIEKYKMFDSFRRK